MKRPAAMMATKAANSGQRVSSTSSLWMFRTVLKPMSGRKRPQETRAAMPASRAARTRSERSDTARGISDLLHFRPAQQPLRQEDHGNGKNGERRDILVVGREICRPQRLDQADKQPAQHGAGKRADAAEHGGGEG